MANYEEQCDCGRYTDHAPCPACEIKQLRAENQRLKAVVEAAKRCIKAERDGVMTNEYYREYKAALKAYEGVKGQ